LNFSRQFLFASFSDNRVSAADVTVCRVSGLQNEALLVGDVIFFDVNRNLPIQVSQGLVDFDSILGNNHCQPNHTYCGGYSFVECVVHHHHPLWLHVNRGVEVGLVNR
jgi:hypothetical protein